MVRVENTAETNPEATGGMIAAGRFLFVVEDVVTTEESVVIETKAVAGFPFDVNEGSQIGKKHKEFLNIYGKAAGRLLQWACAVQLITKDEWKAAKENEAPIDFDENDAVGRVFVGEVKMEPYQGQKEENQGKHFPRLGFRMWPIDDEGAGDVVALPESAEYLPPGFVPPAPKAPAPGQTKGGAGGAAGAKSPAGGKNGGAAGAKANPTSRQATGGAAPQQKKAASDAFDQF